MIKVVLHHVRQLGRNHTRICTLWAKNSFARCLRYLSIYFSTRQSLRPKSPPRADAIMVRFKNRWILAEFIPVVQGQARLGRLGNNPLDGKTIWAALKESVITNFGDTGWGAVGSSLTVKYFSPTTNMCIIRVARDHHNIAWGALTLLASIEGVRYIPNVVHVSGTIKHAQLAAISHNRQVIARFRALAMTPVGYRDSYEDYIKTSTREIEALQD